MISIPAQVPPAASTKATILSKHDQKWLDSRVKEHRAKYKSAFPEGLMYWMIASQNGIEVEDIKAGTDSAEGEEIPISGIEEMLQDEEARETWTEVVGGKFNQPKNQAKYCLPSVVVVDMIQGETSTGKPKLDVVVSDGSGTVKVVAYAKAIDLFAEAKVKVGSVARIPLLNGQYGYWTKTGAKGQANEEVMWYKLSLPPFGKVFKLDAPVTTILKNLDQVVVRSKDACYIDGVITNLDERKNDVCSVCFRWYDDKKPEEHGRCKGAEILETTSYEGTITTTSSQIHKLLWASNPRNGELVVREPKIKVADDTVRIFGVLTERNTVIVTGFKVIDAGEMSVADEDEEPVAKAVAKPKHPVPTKAAKLPVEEPDEDEDDDEEEEETPAPRRRVVPQAPQEAEEEEADEDDDEPAPPPRRRIAPKAPAVPQDEDEDEDEAPAPILRRRVVKAPVAPEPDEDDEEEDEEDEAPVAKPIIRRPLKPAPPVDEEEDDEEEADDEVQAPVIRRAAKSPPPRPVEDEDEEDDEEEDEEPIVKVVSKAKPKAQGSKVTDFIVTALSNFGTPQRVVIIAKSAVKVGLVQCDDPKDVDSLKNAFLPHLEAAIDAGSIKWADDKRSTIWISKGA